MLAGSVGDGPAGPRRPTNHPAPIAFLSGRIAIGDLSWKQWAAMTDLRTIAWRAEIPTLQ